MAITETSNSSAVATTNASNAREEDNPAFARSAHRPPHLAAPAPHIDYDGAGSQMTFEPQDPAFEARVRASFGRQAFMATLGARLASVAPGQVAIELPYRADLAQQHGFLHAGVVAAVADSACGYAALSLMPPGAAVLSVEFKINLLRPAAGAAFRAVGQVVRAGRTLTVCSAEVLALRAMGEEIVVAIMQATMATLHDRGDLVD